MGKIEKQVSFLDLVPETPLAPEIPVDKSVQAAVDANGYRKTGKPHPNQHYSGQHAVQISGAPQSLLNKEVKPIVKGD